MSRERQDHLVSILVRDGGWMTAAALSEVLGVTARSIRSYVTAVNARAGGRPVIASGPSGYRADSAGVAALREGDRKRPDSPRDRMHRLIHVLIDAEEGMDVHEAAAALHVSEATVEADLARIRAMVRDDDMSLGRVGARVTLRGEELARRRLLSSLVREEMAAGTFDVETLRRVAAVAALSGDDLARFKTALVEELAGLGYFVNEFEVMDAVLHVAIAVERTRRGRGLPEPVYEAGAELGRLAGVVGRLATELLGTDLAAGDRLHLATVLRTRVVVPGEGASVGDTVDSEVDAAVRQAAARVSRDYLVSLGREEFLVRLVRHVQNLVLRAHEEAWSPNPLTRSLKTTYPMIFEVAVSIAGDLSERLGMTIRDDEIAYIAMHVGGEVERARGDRARLSATIVCPGYYEVHELLRSSVARSLGQSLEVTEVVTRVDPDWKAIASDLVLTTIDPPAPAEHIVRIQPFLTDADVERVTQVAARIRRGRRLAGLRGELEHYFDAHAFVRGLDASAGEEGVIRRLGGLLAERGVIDEEHIASAVERERMSSTAFTEALAMPHAMRMTARRTAIAIGVAEPSIPWGDQRVQVVAFAAFSENDRAAFQTVFEQFVGVFSERDNVHRLVRRGKDLSGFLDELVAIIGG